MTTETDDSGWRCQLSPGCEYPPGHDGACDHEPAALATVAPADVALDRRVDAAELLRDVFDGARRVVLIGGRDDDEPNLRGEDGIQRGLWNPAARSVYGFEPAVDGEANEFGEGGSVQGYSEAERRAAYRTFIKVRRALVEMTEATDAAGFVAKLREAAGHLGPEVGRQLDASVARFAALAPPAPDDLAPDIFLPEPVDEALP